MIQPPISVLTIENSIAQERKALLSLRVLHIIDFQSWHCGFPAPKNLSSGDTSTVSQIKKNVVFLAFLICVMPSGLWNAPNIFQRVMELVVEGFHWELCLGFVR